MLRTAIPAITAICLGAGLLSWLAGERLFGAGGVLYPVLLVALRTPFEKRI
jgi:hypothetical protein